MLILRKKNNSFFSIEKVFFSLKSFLNLNYIELPYSSKGLLNRLANIYFLKKQKAKILHISGHDHYLLWYPFKKSMLTIHDIEALRRKSGLKKWLFKKLWFDIPIRNASQITTISEFTKKELLKLNNYTTPIEVIPNPLTLEATFSPKYKWAAKTSILHIGTKNNKNLVRLANALKGIDCKLTIIGTLKADQEEALKDNEVEYQSKVNLTDEALIEEYYACDLLAFVSTYEGFGLPIIEAQALGRVVLTSNIASMPEVAGEGAYLIDPFSVKEIRDGIIKLSEDEDLRRNLILEGKENVKRFAPKAIALKYQRLYEQLR